MKCPCIFLVDDDSATLESFQILLEDEGYRIFTATSGCELHDLVLKYVPDLILLDYNLGQDNGGVLTAEMKKNSHTSHIPVIIISADRESRSIALKMGADDFIEKPIEIPLLLSKIEEHIIHE